VTGYKLYWSPGTAAFAPHAVMAENGIEVALERIDHRSGATHSAEYLLLNPGGYVPTLVTPDGDVVYEAAACCLYLAGRHGLTDFMPAPGDPGYAVFLRSLFYLTNTVQEACKIFYYPHRFSGEEASVVRDRAREMLVERWRAVDDHLTKNGPCYLGDRYTLVDLYMTMLADWYPERDELLARYAGVRGNFERVVARPGLQDVLRMHEMIG